MCVTTISVVDVWFFLNDNLNARRMGLCVLPWQVQEKIGKQKGRQKKKKEEREEEKTGTTLVLSLYNVFFFYKRLFGCFGSRSLDHRCLSCAMMRLASRKPVCIAPSTYPNLVGEVASPRERERNSCNNWGSV